MLPFLLLTPLIPLGIIIALILSARQRSEADVRIVGLMIILCVIWIAALMTPFQQLKVSSGDLTVTAERTASADGAKKVVVEKIVALPSEAGPKENADKQAASPPEAEVASTAVLPIPAWVGQPASWNANPPSVVVSSEPNYTVTQCQAEIAQRMQSESQRFIAMVVPWSQAQDQIKLDDDFLRKHVLRETFVSYLPVPQDASSETQRESLQQHHARLEFTDVVRKEVERKFADWRHDELQQRLAWIGMAAGGVLLTVAGLLAVMRISAGSQTGARG